MFMRMPARKRENNRIVKMDKKDNQSFCFSKICRCTFRFFCNLKVKQLVLRAVISAGFLSPDSVCFDQTLLKFLHLAHCDFLRIID